MSLIEFDETPPATMRVTARFTPWSTKKVPRVTRKLGSPVLCSSQPLKAPIARETARAMSTPSQTLRLKYQAVSAAVRPERRHRHTGREVELPADHEQRDGDRHDADRRRAVEDRPDVARRSRKAGATAKNSRATATAPMSAPTSGRPRMARCGRAGRDAVVGRSSSSGSSSQITFDSASTRAVGGELGDLRDVRLVDERRTGRDVARRRRWCCRSSCRARARRRPGSPAGRAAGRWPRRRSHP